jgi:hypothetical protein
MRRNFCRKERKKFSKGGLKVNRVGLRSSPFGWGAGDRSRLRARGRSVQFELYHFFAVVSGLSLFAVYPTGTQSTRPIVDIRLRNLGRRHDSLLLNPGRAAASSGEFWRRAGTDTGRDCRTDHDDRRQSHQRRRAAKLSDGWSARGDRCLHVPLHGIRAGRKFSVVATARVFQMAALPVLFLTITGFSCVGLPPQSPGQPPH